MEMIFPLNDNVLVERLEAETKTSSGILLPGSAAEKPNLANVIAVGPGKMLENGQRANMQVKVSATVALGNYAGQNIKLDGKDLVVLKESDILCIVKK